MQTRLAVLIDADNISAEHASAVFAQVTTLGVPIVRRLYGNPASINAWEAATRDEVYELRPQVSLTSAKNGADIALAIGAMDVLHAGWADAFCIVSNDRDFVPLAVRLRASRMQVHAICTKYDDRLLKVYDTVFDLTPVNPIVAAYLAIAGDREELSLSEVGQLLRAHAPALFVGLEKQGAVRKLLATTGRFVEVGGGSTLRVRLKT